MTRETIYINDFPFPVDATPQGIEGSETAQHVEISASVPEIGEFNLQEHGGAEAFGATALSTRVEKPVTLEVQEQPTLPKAVRNKLKAAGLGWTDAEIMHNAKVVGWKYVQNIRGINRTVLAVDKLITSQEGSDYLWRPDPKAGDIAQMCDDISQVRCGALWHDGDVLDVGHSGHLSVKEILEMDENTLARRISEKSPRLHTAQELKKRAKVFKTEFEAAKVHAQ